MDVILTLIFCLPLIEAKGNAPKKKIHIDKEHLKFDFSGIFGSFVSIFSDAEMDFRYFAAHDYDGNKKLDGLELFTALGHDSKHAHENASEEDHGAPDVIEKQVDDIFRDHDNNNDGFLDYMEFLSVQRDYPDMKKDKKDSGGQTMTGEL